MNPDTGAYEPPSVAGVDGRYPVINATLIGMQIACPSVVPDLSQVVRQSKILTKSLHALQTPLNWLLRQHGRRSKAS